jgi:RNA polymerase sigma factor for flagellar operon FliA
VDKESLFYKYLPLVEKSVMRVKERVPFHVEADDLVNQGVIGLLDAIDRFDPSKGVPFPAFAEIRIRGAIMDYLRSLDWLPRSSRGRLKEYEEALKMLEQRLGREPHPKELAEILGVEEEDVHRLELEFANQFFVSLATPIVEAEDSHILLDVLAGDENESPEAICERVETIELLAKAIDKLPQRDQILLSLYYRDDLTMKEIGKVLDISESRVSQLHSRALLRLKSEIDNLCGNRA